MILLGIETSCDETGAAILKKTEENIKILSNIVATSMNLHGKTGGIIPEVAAREQLKVIIPVIDNSLKEAGVSHRELDAIAVTIGPGLIGSLLVGVETARTLSYVWDKPLIPVNHLFGHIYANFISSSPVILNEVKNLPKKEGPSAKPQDDKKVEFPAIALIVSGGHTDLVFMENIHSISWIAGTRDDAAGEAYDKIGRLLGLPYPAGPIIEKLAKEGNSKAYNFPRPLLHDKELDFSFSGLKTAVFREVQRHSELVSESPQEKKKILKQVQDDKKYNLNDQIVCDLARATQDAIIEVLTVKTMKAVKKYNAKSILLSGGVAANQTLRETFLTLCSQAQIKFFAPAKNLCTDNGAMIAAAGFFNKNTVDWKEISPNPELYFD